MINLLKEKVLTKANKNKALVFSEALIILKRRQLAGFKTSYHKNKTDSQLLLDDCTCDYCKNLKKYVNIKLNHHRLKKRIYNETIPMDSSEFMHTISKVQELEEEFKYHKRLKDNIKKELKLEL